MNTLPMLVGTSWMPRARRDSVRRGDVNELTSSGQPVQVWGVNTLRRMLVWPFFRMYALSSSV